MTAVPDRVPETETPETPQTAPPRDGGSPVKWIVAAVAALALAFAVVRAPIPWPGRAARTTEVAGQRSEACEADAKQAPLNFTLKDVDNRDVRLADFKGKVILIDFWATWCGPCKLEIPWFVELQERYGKQGLQVIGVSVDDKPEQLRPYIADMKMNYPVLQGLDHDDVQDALGPVIGIPTTIVIGRDGSVCRKHIGMSGKDAFEKEIKSLL